MIEHKDYLGQLIKVGSVVARCYNLWKGRDEMRVSKVAKISKTRITFEDGSWSIPAKVLVLETDSYKLADNLMEQEAEERRLDELADEGGWGL